MDGCVLVTGSSSGIGLETARLFRDKGVRVAATARRPETIEGEISENLVAIECDVTSPDSVNRAVKEAEAQLGPIEAVVNNAGYGQAGPVEEVTEDEMRAQFETNVFGVHRVLRATLPLLRERRRGTVVNVSSIGGRISSPFLGIYCASKFAVEALSDALRLELRPFGVRVVVIEPGPIRTGFEDRLRTEAGDLLDEGAESVYGEFARGAERGMTLIDRFTAGPEAVAKVIYKAATMKSPRARYQVTLPAKAGSIAARLAPASAMDFMIASASGL